MFENLEETFDLLPAVPKETLPTIAKEETQEEIDDRNDRRLARETFKNMIEKSENMLSALIEIAEGTEHPRAFEVAANLVKTITDVAAKLDDVASRGLVKGTKEELPGSETHNHLYVGSSEELMKMIRNKGN